MYSGTRLLSPVDITFGDYLRAIITADVDLIPDDTRNYRLAFIDAFRRRGIYPKGIKTLSVESLQFTARPALKPYTQDLFNIIGKFLRDLHRALIYVKDRKEIYDITKEYIAGNKNKSIVGLHSRILIKFDSWWEFEKLTGLVLNSNWRTFGIRASTTDPNDPSFQVHNLRLVSRVGPTGNQINQIIFSLVQRSGILTTENGDFVGHYTPNDGNAPPANGFELRGGCTLIFDLDTQQLRYAITRPLLDTSQLTEQNQIRKIDEQRVKQQYRYQHDEVMMCMTDYSHYFGNGFTNGLNEPSLFYTITN
ncbi:hypothetical protein GO730_39180 [Spirosoma sp. HMF3257]|uniref:Uncharacterized protein n=1 Tax=Spirosoma telluris TaxID=2183553 RepID=A0A327NG35_9BACT|nr:hypothetical protein [Spirosoma telluris]RAI72916.1 hypothetical protein HMF3257_39110 [Spirosoma telluris]